ncbi:MAG: tRNA preQ1(34) S-adenosylmethionine ribosyltransferase-isomerase QueA, partial [Alphaproteobacteria bacterium]|nr:tRNA preQ1(34) S-adenosylmethionine ribosyltransferase-isomerase QueA [Alphaproteobacteria bacterium]
GHGLSAVVRDKPSGEVTLAFNLTAEAFDAALEQVGQMPLPPYIASLRAVDARDKIDYQTVFAEKIGAVAAPTASLHFDQDLLENLRRKGIKFSRVTLHVGAGTFLPVKVDDVSSHKMHSEWGQISDQAAREINQTRREGGRIIPVGTTALRLIESAANSDGLVEPFAAQTDIFIKPGYRFLVADGLMTNFHLPKSTLLMLVSALMGSERIKQIYAHAIEQRYRFFSYGDASILLPDP